LKSDGGALKASSTDEDAGWDEQPCERGLYELLSTAGAWMQQVSSLEASSKARTGVATRLHGECARHATEILSLVASHAGLDRAAASAVEAWSTSVAGPGADTGGLSRLDLDAEHLGASADRAAFVLQLCERYLRVAGAALGRGTPHEPSRIIASHAAGLPASRVGSQSSDYRLVHSCLSLCRSYASIEGGACRAAALRAGVTAEWRTAGRDSGGLLVSWEADGGWMQTHGTISLAADRTIPLWRLSGAAVSSWADEGFFALGHGVARAAGATMAPAVCGGLTGVARVWQDVILPAAKELARGSGELQDVDVLTRAAEAWSEGRDWAHEAQVYTDA